MINMDMIGWVGSFLLAYCALPEVYRSWKRKRCDIGWMMLIMWTLGEICMLVYTNENPVRLNCFVNTILCFILIYYKRRS